MQLIPGKQETSEGVSMYTLEKIELLIMNSTLSEYRRGIMYERLKNIEHEQDGINMMEELKPNQLPVLNKEKGIAKFVKDIGRNE